MKRILVTGGCGFIGANFVRHMIAADPQLHVVNLDALTYAGNPENLADLAEHPRYTFVHGSIADAQAVARALAAPTDALVNFAAESHVDRSITDPGVFVHTNVLGTQILLDAARRHNVSRYVQISTDEVYGSLDATGRFLESTPIQPRSPYSASKAGADLLVLSYHHTYGLPTLITRSSNNYGPYQFPEKLVPLFITNALENRPVPVYGAGQNVRDWLYVEDNCRAIELVLRRGTPGSVYNIGGESERNNLEMTRAILSATGKDDSLIQYVKDRPGHDFRYAIDITHIRTHLGWQPSVTLEEGLARTVAWYKKNESWWRRIKSGEYRKYYEQHYGVRYDAATPS